MCVGFWTTEHPEYALILANNRDEFLSRPTKPASVHHFRSCSASKHPHHTHVEGSEVISGLDAKAGGTWLGVNRHGRIAMLTNITEQPHHHHIYSRGHLVSDFLLSDPKTENMEQFIKRLTNRPPSTPLPSTTTRTKPVTTKAISQGLGATNMLSVMEMPELGDEEEVEYDYAGFNLLLVSMAQEDAKPRSVPQNAGEHEDEILPEIVPRMALMTNSGEGGRLTARWLEGDEARLGGVSNGVDGSTMEMWTKIELGKRALSDLIRREIELGAHSTETTKRCRCYVAHRHDSFHPSAPAHLECVREEGSDCDVVKADKAKTKQDREEALIEGVFDVLALKDTDTNARDDFFGSVRVDPRHLEIAVDGGARTVEGWYATRTSTVLLVRKDGCVVYRERDIWRLSSSDLERAASPFSECRCMSPIIPGEVVEAEHECRLPIAEQGLFPVMGDRKEDREHIFWLYL